MTLGGRIQRMRKERGLSQEQLAEQVGVSRQAVSKWEVDAALPETDKLVALARAFGVSTDDLLGNQPPPGPEAPRRDRHGDSLGWLLHLARTRGYRAGYLLVGWGIFVLAASALVGFIWYQQLAGPMAAFGIPLSQMSPSVWTPFLFVGFAGLLGLIAVIGGLVAVVRGKRKRREEG